MISYGWDLDQYQPRAPRAVKHREDVPLDALVVLAVADGFSLRRKDLFFIEQLIERFSGTPDIFLLLVGSATDQVTPRPSVRIIPNTHNERHLSLIYSTADAFATQQDPSLQQRTANRCRRIAEKKYALNLQAMRYRKIYGEIMSNTDSSSGVEELSDHG